MSKTTQGSGVPSLTPVLTTLVTIAATLLASAGLTAVLPATASAYATIEGPPIYSSATGLPDGRVWEQVSPADKSGNEAGARTVEQISPFGAEEHYALAAADGDSVLFEATGPIGEAANPIVPYYVATKNQGAAGWSTRGMTPAPQQSVNEIGGVLGGLVGYVDPSADLSHAMFVPGKGTYAPLPEQCIGGQLFLSGSDPFVPATWVEKAEGEGPAEACQAGTARGVPVGGTPDFSTVYFTDPGTLLPEDAERAAHALPEKGTGQVEAWGFYEDREGALREAGILPGPGEKFDPFGAVPAASGHVRATAGNQVSANGSRAFFVSPDPDSCQQRGGHNDCALDPPELYVRENGERTQLVSRDTLLPAVGGLPAPAPTGASPVLNPTAASGGTEAPGTEGSYVFASPDGSQAFFQSDDALTKPAEEASPGSEAKTYDFDLETGALTYLPNVSGRIVETDTDGSSFAFVKPETGSSPEELDLWSAGPAGGSVTPITQLSQPGGVSLARMSSDGSVVVFRTAAALPGAFNSGSFQQIYRYDVAANTLGCVSCAPHGVTPTGNASMGPLQFSEEEERNQGSRYNGFAGVGFEIRGMVAERGISANGDRVFFETPDPLVPRDTNTGTTLYSYQREDYRTQGNDVYEWENGVVYLISSGKSPLDSFFLDNSENGDDVFFATAEGLVPGDVDGGYDVYDARVPHPGDNPPPAAVACAGSVCQGPPNVPVPLTPPASATFAGLGNPTPEETTPGGGESNPKTTTKTVKCKKNQVKKKNRCVKKSKAKKSSKKKGK